MLESRPKDGPPPPTPPQPKSGLPDFGQLEVPNPGMPGFDGEGSRPTSPPALIHFLRAAGRSALQIFHAVERHQLRLKPALRLLERSPVAVSLTEPVTLNGPPNSFCSALRVRSHLSSTLEMSAPNDTLVSVGRKLKRSAWLVAQLWTCPVAFGSDRVIETPFCHVNETSSPTGTERLNVVPSLPCSCEGSTRLSIEKRQSRRPIYKGQEGASVRPWARKPRSPSRRGAFDARDRN